MSNEEMVQDRERQPHFFDRFWPKRTLALILGLSMIVALIIPAAFRIEKSEPEAAETQPAGSQTQTQAQEPDAAELGAYSEAFLLAYELSVETMAQGDYEAALGYAEKCLSVAASQEEIVTALAQKGDALFSLERYGEAEETYREIAGMGADELVSAYALNNKIARCQLLEGKLEDALLSCNLALELAGSDLERAEIHAVRGVVLFYGGAFAEAKKDFETALENGYDEPELLRTQIEQCEQQLAAQAGGQAAYADPGSQAGTQSGTSQAEAAPPEPTEGEKNAALYYFGGKYELAKEEFRKLLGKSYYYTDMQLYSNIAKCEYLLGNYAEAVASCESGLQQKGGSERAALHTLRGSAYMALGESALAAADFEAAVGYGAADPELNTLQAAICYYFSGNYEKCVELGTPLIDRSGYEEAALWVGFSKYMLGDLAAAAELLDKSVDLDQSYSRKDELYRLKARCEFQLGRFQEAIESANNGLAEGAVLTEDDREIASDLYYLRGSSKLSTGQYEAALTDLDAALGLSTENEYDLLTQMTLCEFLLARYEDAAAHGNRAMEVGSATSDLCYWVGLAEFSTEQFEKARETLKHCEELEPTKENIWFYIGVCSFSMEDYETAIEQFTASIEAEEPAADRSRYNRSICYLQREEYPKAKEDLEIAANSASEDVASDAADLLKSLSSVLG